MGSTFGTYSIAHSGMYVNQAALTTTSTNLANVDTTGASKVEVNSAELTTARSDGTTTGGGVSVESIKRSRDIYLDSAYRTENAASNYLSVKSGNLEYMDEILEEYETSSTTTSTSTTTTTDGLQTAINSFFTAWQTLSTDSTTESTRQDVTSAGVALVKAMQDVDKQLQQLQTDAVSAVKDGVDSLNDYASQVANLNKQIVEEEAGGGEASYLRDQRDYILDEMSSLANISVNESNGNLTVTIGGVPIVNGDTANSLEVEGTGTTSDPLTVKWSNSGYKASISSGSIAAYLEDADQSGYETIDSTSIPYNFTTDATSSISTMRQALNDLITTVATKVNALSTSGVDLDGNAGLAFFTTTDSSEPLSITNIQVNQKLLDDSDKVVTSSSTKDGDNTIANAISDLATDTSCYKSSGLSLDITDFYKAVTSWIGTTGETASSSYTTEYSLAEQLDTQRQSVSSISIDEEMSNLIKFQNGYAASAKVMSTIDSMLGDLMDEIS